MGMTEPTVRVNEYEMSVKNGTVEVLESKYCTESLFETLVCAVQDESGEFWDIVNGLVEKGVSWSDITRQCMDEIQGLRDNDTAFIMCCCALRDEDRNDAIFDFCMNFDIGNYPDIRYGRVSKEVTRRIVRNVRENVDLTQRGFIKDNKSIILERFGKYLDGDAGSFESGVEHDSGDGGFQINSMNYIKFTLDKKAKKEVENMMNGHVSECRIPNRP